MKILGIDPGSSRMGYSLLEKNGSKLTLLKAGTLEIKESDVNQKYFYLGKGFEKIINNFSPDLVAIEKIFFSKNIKTAIEVAQARGILLYLSVKSQIPVIEFTPQQVKQNITNYGSADKKAVARMVAAILGSAPFSNELDDTTDAIAIAITAASFSS